MRKNVEDLNERGEALRNTENAAEEVIFIVIHTALPFITIFSCTYREYLDGWTGTESR